MVVVGTAPKLGLIRVGHGHGVDTVYRFLPLTFESERYLESATSARGERTEDFLFKAPVLCVVRINGDRVPPFVFSEVDLFAAKFALE